MHRIKSCPQYVTLKMYWAECDHTGPGQVVFKLLIIFSQGNKTRLAVVLLNRYFTMESQTVLSMNILGGGDLFALILKPQLRVSVDSRKWSFSKNFTSTASPKCETLFFLFFIFLFINLIYLFVWQKPSRQPRLNECALLWRHKTVITLTKETASKYNHYEDHTQRWVVL